MNVGAVHERQRVPLELTLSADPGTIAIARMFAGTIARTLGLPEDRIEDVKIAVSEAVSSAVHHAGDAREQVIVRAFGRDDDDTVFEVIGGRPPGPRLADDPGGYDTDLSLTLVRALFPRASADTDAQGRHRMCIPVAVSLGNAL